MSAPPHNLQLVIDFVNTLDVEVGVDRTDTPAHLTEWLDDHGLRAPHAPGLEIHEFEQGIELRESLRTVLMTHSRREDARGQAARHLEAVAERGQLSVCFAENGSIDIAPRAHGYDGVLARLLVPITHAAMDGTWARTKACVADDCQWAFYDSSRNRSGRWCDMAVCGNREKVRTYRSKHPDSAARR
ncbi:MAG: CGNR zinc finger domain-containing protein [Solirubrobacteraceae bacterium]